MITLNEYIKAERSRSGKYLASKIKRDHTIRVQNIALVKRFKLPDKCFKVCFTWVHPTNKQDPDNIAFAKKFVLDGLVKAGSLPNDGFKNISGFSDEFVHDKDSKFIWCKVEFKLS